LPIADACELIRQTAIGLQYIHENHLVHRDIKPSNLMLTPQGQVKILDLGLALLGSEQTPGKEVTSNGLAMGTTIATFYPLSEVPYNGLRASGSRGFSDFPGFRRHDHRRRASPRQQPTIGQKCPMVCRGL
jgi:serine/threonine protein kinase